MDSEILKYLKISDNESWREKRKNTVKTLGRKGDESERGEKREGESKEMKNRPFKQEKK